MTQMTQHITTGTVDRIERKVKEILSSYNSTPTELLAAAEMFKGLVEYEKLLVQKNN